MTLDLEKFHKLLPKNEKWRKVVGIIFILVGIISVITPFTPLGFLLLIGLEVLGIRELAWEKVKYWWKRY